MISATACVWYMDCIKTQDFFPLWEQVWIMYALYTAERVCEKQHFVQLMCTPISTQATRQTSGYSFCDTSTENTAPDYLLPSGLLQPYSTSWKNLNNPHQSNFELCRRLDIPFKKQARNLFSQTELQMKQVCSAPAHRQARDTQMSDRSCLHPGQSPARQPHNTGGLSQFASSWQTRDSIYTDVDVREAFKSQSTQTVRHPNNIDQYRVLAARISLCICSIIAECSKLGPRVSLSL